MAKCDGWCTPLYIYLALAVMSLIATVRLHFNDPKTVSMEAVLMSVIYKVFWCGVIYVLCSTCHENVAWVLLLIPLVFMLLLMFLIFGAIGALVADKRRHN